MKKLIITLYLQAFISQTHAQGKTDKQSKILYTLANNVSSGPSSIPLIGFVNLSKGTHRA